ncbi:phosphate starvation-inducible protein PhoH [Cohnella faecalis]|uniref:Phosphate starvation-inducible protein PhoH n=1 Tax=Cohnella faecalis TaxID=2315694 RepID=A0A398CL37_9BACL|nr:phosphate starvation-inducible protein PhoH [Cohnella faecalis]RIE04046.1 phosphate starvation-inducible protein PhoH [Cohnella faecalis]
MNNSQQRILLLRVETYFTGEQMGSPPNVEGIDLGDQYELAQCDLSPYICLAIDGIADQEHLYKEKAIIESFLNLGKIVVFCGNLFRPWLPGGRSFVPRAIVDHRDYAVGNPDPAHPIFQGVRSEDMTYNKGVAGFFARGHHPLPPSATPLLTLPGGEPITYIDRQSTSGTIVVHAGNNLFGYWSEANSSGRIGPQLMQWVQEEYRRLQEGRERV